MGEETSSGDETTVANGDVVYDEDDEALGVVAGATSDGFTVSIEEEIEYVEEVPGEDEPGAGSSGDRGAPPDESVEEIDPQEHDPGPEFGEGYIVWRCEACGEIGELEDGLPDECPNCGSESVVKYRED